jgi:prepilin-type N-terminal cleavage/methylation domain-containing protein
MEVRKGFTLIELIMVVAIIAFLSLIAVLNFMRYLTKAKRIEAYMNLSSLCLSRRLILRSMVLIHHNCREQKVSDESLKVTKEGGKQESFYYTYGFPGVKRQNYFTGKLKTALSDLSLTYANKEGFVAY